jgi:HEAT repeat protein
VSLPVLQAQLTAERKPAVREELVTALQLYNDEAANDAMAQALLQEQSPDVRRKLIDAFEELHLTRHVSVLKQALLREDVTSIRRRIHKVLKQLEPPVPFMAEDDPFEQTVQEVTDTSFGA